MDSSQIIALDFEDLDNAYLSTWEDVWSEIKRRTTSAPKHYIFLDEVQRIAGYEKLVDGLFARKGHDVYITGSNAYMLSSEISTLLSGRYVEIQIHPLSFREYWMALGQPDVLRTYQQYVQTGGFPHLVSFGNDATMVHDYLAAIYQTILLKDILTRKSFRDVSTLTRVARFLFDNIGNLTNARKISDTLSSAN